MKSILPDIHIPEIALHEEIIRRASDYGDRQALVCGETGHSLTYRQLTHYIKAVSSGLVKAGVTMDTKVAIIASNIPEYALFFFGVLGAGGTATTINPVYTASEIAQQISIAEASMIITMTGYETQINNAIQKIGPAKIKAKFMFGKKVPGYIPFSELMKDDGTRYPRVNYDVKDHVAAIPFSSGTTGLPKGVMLTHYNIIANIYQNQTMFFPPTMSLYNKQQGERTLGVLPFFHSFGLSCILCLQLAMGCTVVTLRRFQPVLFLETIQNHKISGLAVVPPMVLLIAKDPRVNKYDLSSIKSTFCGAAPLSAELINEYKAKAPGIMSQGYGMTESGPSLSGPIPGRHIEIGSAGYLVPNTELKVVDRETGEEITEAGKRGELLFRGPQVMKGYYNNREATAATIDRDGWLHTGDVGYYNKKGNIFVVDRVKELIKYKGFQVAPAELEAILLNHTSISDAAVIGVPDSEAGELPRAYVVLKPGENVNVQDLQRYFRENAAGYKQLRGGIVFTRQIPKSASGKILRRQLKQMALQSKL